MNDKISIVVEAGKAVPPAALASTIILGYTLQDWALIGSLALIVLQIFFLLKKEIFKRKDK